MSLLGGLFGLDAGKATQKAAKKNSALYDQMGQQGTGFINTGEQKSSDALNQAIGQFSPYQQTGAAANSMVANALGLNGAAGNAAAQGAYQASPGYDWAVNQAMQGVNRAAAAGGMSASGNAMIAAQDRAKQLANQDYTGWLDRIIGQSAQGLSAAGGAAQGWGNLANLFQNTTGQRLDLANAVTGGKTGANNMYAQGGEMNAAGLANIGSSLGGLFGTAFKGFSF